MDYHHHFKKRFGQNFLNDENILNKIVEKANMPKDTLAIEIGPGAGALTSKLQEVATNVLAYEIDTELRDSLEEKFKNTNVQFIWDDFLNRNISEDIKSYQNKNIYVVANIPYYITTPILEKIVESGVDITKIVIMVQKEVAERLSAKPGSKDYGSITVFLNYFYDIDELFVVSRNCFVPKPNVDSAVISLEKKKLVRKAKNEKLFFALIRDSFQYRRKTLHNNLKKYDWNTIEKVLLERDLDLNIRAEMLNLDVFIDISDALESKNEKKSI